MHSRAQQTVPGFKINLIKTTKRIRKQENQTEFETVSTVDELNNRTNLQLEDQLGKSKGQRERRSETFGC